MTRTHTIIDSPLGELTLVSDDGALTGVYYPHHWYLPDPATFGVPHRVRVRGRRGAARRVLRRPADGVRAADVDGRRRVPGTRLGADRAHPVRGDDHVRRARTRARRPGDRACRRRSCRPQSALDRRSVPPGRRQGRQAHRVRRRPGAQAAAPRPRGPHRGTRGVGGSALLIATTRSPGYGSSIVLPMYRQCSSRRRRPAAGRRSQRPPAGSPDALRWAAWRSC